MVCSLRLNPYRLRAASHGAVGDIQVLLLDDCRLEGFSNDGVIRFGDCREKAFARYPLLSGLSIKLVKTGEDRIGEDHVTRDVVFVDADGAEAAHRQPRAVTQSHDTQVCFALGGPVTEDLDVAVYLVGVPYRVASRVGSKKEWRHQATAPEAFPSLPDVPAHILCTTFFECLTHLGLKSVGFAILIGKEDIG